MRSCPLHEPTEQTDGHAPHTDDPSASQRDCKDPCKMTHTIFAFSTRHPIATQPFPAQRPATIEVKVVKCAAETTSIAAGCMDCSCMLRQLHAGCWKAALAEERSCTSSKVSQDHLQSSLLTLE